jgi:hypothetical protein
MGFTPLPARAQAARVATIQPETKARLVLQSRLSSKLNEVGDHISAVLYEPVFSDGQLVMARGAEFHGRVTAVSAAGRPQKSAQMSIVFDRVLMPWGQEPVSVVITAIDDWARDEKLKADAEGDVKGGRDGGKTVDNVIKGGEIGALGGTAVVFASPSTGTLAAAGGVIGGGMLAGLLLTKGKEVRVEPGAVFRIKFVKPMTLPVIQTPGATPRPIQQEEPPKEADPAKKP